MFAVVSSGGIYIREFPPAPKLNISRSNDFGILSWTVPSSDLVVQENSDPNKTNWSSIATMPTLNLTNLNNELAVPLHPQDRFYRLATP